MKSRHEKMRPGASNMVKERSEPPGPTHLRSPDVFPSRHVAIPATDESKIEIPADSPPRLNHFERQRNAVTEAAAMPDEFPVRPLLVAGAVTEDGREPAYQTELLALFRQRMRLLAGIGLGASPAVVFISWRLMPRHILPIALAYTTLAVYCALVRLASPKLASVSKSRLFVFSSYAFVCAIASSVLSLAGAHSELLYGGQIHIILSVLLLPLALWECAIIGVMVNLSLSWAEFWSSTTHTNVYTTHLFVMLTITAFVLCIAHMQDILRRRAFDATFDVMRSAARLQALTFMDTLTGGFNRRYLDRMLRGEIARAIRFERPLSVVMFDLDNFKRVNDTRGHSAGDDVLREVWQAAQITIREVDTLARYGGDEFSLVLPETDEESAHAVAERLQLTSAERLRERFGEDAIESQVTLSVGITTVRPSETIHPDKILDNADARLYEAKRCGKNNIAA